MKDSKGDLVARSDTDYEAFSATEAAWDSYEQEQEFLRFCAQERLKQGLRGHVLPYDFRPDLAKGKPTLSY